MVINALLLAGGYGTRLRPITITKPKCMVEVGGKPILENWLRKLEGIGCKTAIVNTHYLADQVEGYIKKRSGLTDMSIMLSHEEDLLGTGGALVKHRELLGVDVGMAVHVDNATTLDLSELISRHYERPKHCIMTMQTFTTKSPSQCGIVETTDEGLVTAFHEKAFDISLHGPIPFDPFLLEVVGQVQPLFISFGELDLT